MRITFITAGAAGMYCGSCMRDNALVRALRRLGHDAVLLPTYTPIRTDEPDVSEPRVFFGGINVYLQEKSWLFRHTPAFIDRLFNRPAMLRWAARYAHRTKYDQLGGLTISMLQGRHGHQRKELDKLLAWFREHRPEAVVLSNVLLSGMIPDLRRELNVPIFATLQGDDIFLDALTPGDRSRCLELIRENCQFTAGLLATSRYYADHMSGYLGIERGRIAVVPPGISLEGHDGPRLERGDGRSVIGYFARIAPEKGLHRLVDAFIELRKTTKAPLLRVGGWLGEQHRAYLSEQEKKIHLAGLAGDYERVDVPDLAAKSRFLRSLDLFCVPTEYREPKGLYLLEAWANGVPAVAPTHGCFPELTEATGGTRLVPPGDPRALVAELFHMIQNPDLGRQMGAGARAAVRERYSAEAMAHATLAAIDRFTPSGTAP